jgi:[acyl-carrier-protein] S-malonyltransferase
MFEASGELREWIRKTPLSNLETAVISNYTALPQYRAAQVEENLVFQVYSCVKWEASVRYMLAQGVTDFYEFGPGKVLKGLMRRIDPAARVVSIEKKADIEEIFSS